MARLNCNGAKYCASTVWTLIAVCSGVLAYKNIRSIQGHRFQILRKTCPGLRNKIQFWPPAGGAGEAISYQSSSTKGLLMSITREVAFELACKIYHVASRTFSTVGEYRSFHLQIHTLCCLLTCSSPFFVPLNYVCSSIHRNIIVIVPETHRETIQLLPSQVCSLHSLSSATIITY